MTILEVTIALPWAVPAVGPVSSNTLHVDIGGQSVGTAAETALNIIAAQYEGFTHWASTLDGTSRLTAYDTSDPRPRPPVAVIDGAITPGTDAAPSACAIMAQLGSQVPANGDRSRGKGRVRLGPLHQAALNDTGQWQTSVCLDVFDMFEAISVNLQADDMVVVVGSEQHGFLPVASLKVPNKVALISRRSKPATYVQTA